MRKPVLQAGKSKGDQDHGVKVEDWKDGSPVRALALADRTQVRSPSLHMAL